MFTKLTEKRMKGIERMLDEDIIDAVSGAVDGKILGTKSKLNGVLVLTSSRVLFYYKKMIGGYQSEEYPLNRINSINFNYGRLVSSMKIHTSGNDLEMGWIPKDEGVEDFVKNVKTHINLPAANTSMGNQSIDIADQLKKLADLKEQGILTEDEFTTQKAKCLGNGNMDIMDETNILSAKSPKLSESIKTEEAGGKSPLDRASTVGLSIGVSMFGLLWLVLMYDDATVKADPVIYLVLFGILGVFVGLFLTVPFYLYYKMRK